MRKIFAGFELALLFVLCGCTPGVFFDIRNDTSAAIQLEYTVKQKYCLSDLTTPHVQVVLNPGQSQRVGVSWQSLLNDGYTAAKDFIDIAAYRAIFEDLAVRSPGGDAIALLPDFRQEDIEYEHPFVSSVVYVLSID